MTDKNELSPILNAYHHSAPPAHRAWRGKSCCRDISDVAVGWAVTPAATAGTKYLSRCGHAKERIVSSGCSKRARGGLRRGYLHQKPWCKRRSRTKPRRGSRDVRSKDMTRVGGGRTKGFIFYLAREKRAIRGADGEKKSSTEKDQG